MDRRDFIRTGVLTAGGSAIAAHPLFALSAPRLYPNSPSAVAHLASPAWRRGPNGEIRLNANENALGVSPKAREAIIDGISQANRYPFAAKGGLTSKLEGIVGVEDGSVFLTNGSTEVIQMVVQGLGGEDLNIVVADPTFEDILEFAAPEGSNVVKVPLAADFSHDLVGMEAATRGMNGPTVVYICNPNNPTGTITDPDAVQAWIGRAPDNVYFLVDEAYFELVIDPAYRSLKDLVASNPRVVVARTFSKIHGMAGMRLGYGIAHPDLVKHLLPYAPGTNTNALALAAGTASLDDEVHLKKSLEYNLRSKAIVTDTLDDLGLHYLPSHTNFVMHRIKGELSTYRDRMMDAGFGVGRDFPPLMDHNRLSLGLPEEMEAWAATARDFRSKGWL